MLLYMKAFMRKKSLRIIGLFTLGFLVIYFILRYIGIQETWAVLREAHSTFLLFGLSIQLLSFALWSYRWKIILGAAKGTISTKNLFISLFSGVLINNITPSAKTGGEPVRAYTLGIMEDITVERVFATTTADRVFDSFPFASLSLFSIAYLFFLKDIPSWVQYVLIFALSFSIFLLFITIYLCINLEAAKKVVFALINLVGKIFPKVEEYTDLIEERIISFNKTVVRISKNRGIMVKALSLSFLMLFCAFLRVYLMFIAVGQDVNFIVPIIVTIVGIQVGMIPLLPGGLGAHEGIMILIFSIFSIQSAVAASVTILVRLLSYWLGIFIGIPCFLYSNKTVKDMLERQREES